MKKTKIGAILEALLNGHALTVRSCMILCGTHKLSSRVADLEQQYNFRAIRKWEESESRYGGIDRYMQYSISREDVVRIKDALKPTIGSCEAD